MQFGDELSQKQIRDRLKFSYAFENAISALLFIAFCLYTWLIKLPDINWIIALTGWSAIDWVAHLTHPENFVHDFASGINLYDKSSFMHVYLLAQQWFGISPENLIPAVILFEIVFLAGCGVFFLRTIVPSASPLASCIFAVLLISSSARDMDLSNFGAPFFWGLYYNAADGLRLLAVALFFRGMVLSSAILFAASMTIHPLMALAGCAFVLGYLLVDRRIAEPKRLGLGVVLFCAVTLVWWILKFGNAEISSGTVDAQIWIDTARAFNFHFFPIDFGTLTKEHDSRILPLLCLLALATFYLSVICLDDCQCKAVLSGFLLLSALVAVGLLISVFAPVPALIKLSLPRVSAMLILFALAITVAGLVNDILFNSPLWRALAFATLFSPFFLKPGFPALPMLLLVMPRGVSWLKSTRPWLVRYSPLVLCMTIVLLGVCYWAAGVIQPQHSVAYLGGYFFWQIVAVAGALFVLLRFLDHTNVKFLQPAFVFVVLILSTIWFSSQWQRRHLPEESYKKMGNDYLEAQQWANKNTPSNSLFMVDPTIYYGWRDFSSRSSFGNLREWLHTSWMYDSNETSYFEGKKRFNELGIDLAPYLGMSTIRLAGFKQLSRDVQERFYNMDSDWFSYLSDRYGISYLVLSKSAIHKAYPFAVAFENGSYVIYKMTQ